MEFSLGNRFPGFVAAPFLLSVLAVSLLFQGFCALFECLFSSFPPLIPPLSLTNFRTFPTVEFTLGIHPRILFAVYVHIL